ncbi:MAG: uncharacterized membrane protein (UPF0127 family) [Arenicella sp.]|jgi:uncharacterized membrane protein (UPF0127 family)
MKKPGLVAIVLLIIFGMSYLVIFMPKDSNNGNSKMKTEPKFRKDGELKFIKPSDSSFQQKIEIEIADEDWERAQGLMYRTKMGENQGMLFIFEEEEIQSFWMRNTNISLDIMYVNSNKEIVSIQKYATPFSDESLPSEGDAQYVVEVNAGFSDRYELKAGDKISF